MRTTCQVLEQETRKRECKMIESNDTQMPVTATNDTSERKCSDYGCVLLLLDIQVSMLAPPPIGVPASGSVRNTHPPPLIVHVRNNGDVGDPDERNSDGWQLIFPPLPSELIIDKRKNNAFAGTELGDVVPSTAEIVVAGFQTDYSIRATCSAALGRGNEVLLIREAHATYDRIEVLHGGGVTSADKIQAEVEAELEEAGVHLLEMKDLPGLFTGR